MRSSFVFMPWRLSLDDVKGEKQVTWVPALHVIKNILVSHHPHHNTCTLYTCSTVHREPLLSVIKTILVPCCLNHNTCTLYTYSTEYREPPTTGTVRQPIKGLQNQQIYQSPGKIHSYFTLIFYIIVSSFCKSFCNIRSLYIAINLKFHGVSTVSV